MTEKLKKIRIIFFGTPVFAVPSLAILHKNYQVVGVVTNIDKPSGRGHKMHYGAVKQFALQYKLPILQLHKLKNNEEFLQIWHSWRPDLAVVVAYGQLIPSTLLTLPHFGFINVHASLLPKLRGASPINYAIWQGHTRSGVTIMCLDRGMDTGPILSQKSVPLAAAETADSLHDKLSTGSAQLLIETLPDYVAGKIKPHPQDSRQATYCQKIRPTDAEINWQQPASQIDRQVRAFTTYPGAYTYCGKLRVKIMTAKLAANTNELIITHVQPAGKKIMTYTEFRRGYPRCPLPPVS